MRCTVQIVRWPAISVRNCSIDHESNAARFPRDFREYFSTPHSHRHWPPKCKPDTERVAGAELMRSAIRRPNFQQYSIRLAALLCIVDRAYGPAATKKCKQKWRYSVFAMINYEIRIISSQACFVNAQLHCDHNHIRVAIRHAYSQNYNTLNCQRMTSIRIWHDQIRYRVCFNFTFLIYSLLPLSLLSFCFCCDVLHFNCLWYCVVIR